MSVDAKLLASVAFAIFKASFHEDDADNLIREKWNEWEDDRTLAIRRAHFAIRAHEQHLVQHRRPTDRAQVIHDRVLFEESGGKYGSPDPAGVSEMIYEAQELVPELRELAGQWSSYGSAGRAKWLTRSADMIERLAALQTINERGKGQ